MRAVDVARTVMESLEAQDWATVNAHLAGEFVFAGPVPEPIGKHQWVGLQPQLQTAMPDWSFNVSSIEDKGNIIRFTIHITGTQTNDLDLSAMGLPVIPAMVCRVYWRSLASRCRTNPRLGAHREVRPLPPLLPARQHMKCSPILPYSDNYKTTSWHELA
jgi:hypothetical protein